MSIRTATAADTDDIVKVFLACWRQSYLGLLPDAVIAAMTEERAHALWVDALARPAGGVLVADDGAGVLGVTRYEVAGTTGTIGSLYVSPRAQGQGCGARLLDAAWQALVREGVQSATLWVFAANTPALEFYRHHGWIPDGTTRVEDEFGIPELHLTRS